MDGRRVLGYTFGVIEASKAVVGDLYAFGETEAVENPICETLLDHLLETLQAMPGVDRMESQLLMFPAGALTGTFQKRGFVPIPRIFMVADLSGRGSMLRNAVTAPACPSGFELQPWNASAYDEAARLIHEAYQGHVDAGVNDQYRSVQGAARFLHNIIRFPGCGVFDGVHSALLRDERTGSLAALLLCSRVRHDMGHITQLCVKPGYRGRGLGRSLLVNCTDTLARFGIRGVSLTVTESNRGAAQLYLNQGFNPLHRFEAWVWGDQ